MAYDPMLMLAVFGVFAVGLLGLALCIVGLSWFVTHPSEHGDSLRRGKRGRILALSIAGILLVGVGMLPFAPPLF